jgi:beta-lactamase class A
MHMQLLIAGIALFITSLTFAAAPTSQPFESYVLGYDTPVDADLQKKVEAIDTELRERIGMTSDQAAVGVLDLEHLKLALIRPDAGDYAASVPKVGILLAYFQLHPEAVDHLDPQTEKELGMMAKQSNNQMASKFSHEIGLKKVQEVINSYDLYNADHGGGIWVGKHYGKDTEKYPDPVGHNSHAATVRQLMRYWLWLEQGKLVSPAASKKMREIFASPSLEADDIKFVKGLKGRDVQIVRKWGSWDKWYHDTAIVTGPGRHYILVAMTQHEKGDDYLEALAPRVDDLMQGK